MNASDGAGHAPSLRAFRFTGSWGQWQIPAADALVRRAPPIRFKPGPTEPPERIWNPARAVGLQVGGAGNNGPPERQSSHMTPSTVPPAELFTEAQPREVQQWLRDGEALLVDVREPDEHAREHIAGARLVPLSRFDPRRAADGLQPGQRLVLHCRGGRRSADAARMAAPLCEAGVRVISLAGGIEAWKRENLPVEVNRQASGISVMRQVQLTIGAGVLIGSALAWFLHPAFIAIPAFFGAGLMFAGATGTCGLAAVIARMPWNRVGGGGSRCASGSCG